MEIKKLTKSNLFVLVTALFKQQNIKTTEGIHEGSNNDKRVEEVKVTIAFLMFKIVNSLLCFSFFIKVTFYSIDYNILLFTVIYMILCHAEM